MSYRSITLHSIINRMEDKLKGEIMLGETKRTVVCTSIAGEFESW